MVLGRKGIVVVGWSGGTDQLDLLLYSLRGYHKYPIYIVMNDVRNAPLQWLLELHQNYNIIVTEDDRFECGALQAIMDTTDLDEWLLLQDTVEILNPYFIERMFDTEGSVTFGPHFEHYLGKFRREVLEKIVIPEVKTKWDAVQQEIHFLKAYMEADDKGITTMFPDFTDKNFENNTERRWGRVNLKLENRYLIKRKGTWAIPT